MVWKNYRQRTAAIFVLFLSAGLFTISYHYRNFALLLIAIFLLACVATVWSRRLKSAGVVFSSLFFYLAVAEIVCGLMTSQPANKDGSHSYSYIYANDYRLTQFTWMDAYIAHPYFGYVSPWGIKSVYETLDNKVSGDFILAINGGSVAGIFCDWLKEKEEMIHAIGEVIPEAKQKHIKILCLAIGGYKQPQQFFISSFFIDKIDYSMNIDGFNEFLDVQYTSVFPPEFPGLSPKFYMTDEKGAYWRYAATGLKRFFIWINNPPTRVLSYSHLYYNFYALASMALYNGCIFTENKYFERNFGGEPSTFAGKAAVWKKYTLLQSKLYSSLNKPAIFIIQPNQYLHDSKPLSTEEREKSFNADNAEYYNNGMQALRIAAVEIEPNVKIFDMTQIFKQTEETLYFDPCCHFNERGNEILARSIVLALARQQ